MLVFPNSKINIGLNIINKRTDGFHNLETIFYPIRLTDIFEFTESNSETELNVTGLNININMDDNLIFKAFRLLKNKYNLPDINMHLHKIIPTGAGLGGGSSNAAYVLRSLNDHFTLKIDHVELESYAQSLGSDCPFFIRNKPVFAQSTGNIFTDISIDLSKYYILIVKPDIHISTKEAFSEIKPQVPKHSLRDLINKPIDKWKAVIKNDFENTIFSQFPIISKIKDKIYEAGAIYSQMSGSGSSVFGIFDFEPKIPSEFEKYFIYIQKPIVKD